MGRIPKHNYKDPYFLLEIEGLARDGASDKELAEYLGINPAYFCEIKKKYPEFSDAIARARRPLNVIVENALYKRTIGMKVKTITRRYLEKKCTCGNDPKCKQCKGVGHYKLVDTEVVQETETELPPDPFSIKNWLMAKKPDTWNKEPLKVEHSGEVKGQGVTLIFNEVERKDDTGEKTDSGISSP
jgi:hypothetical protein